MRAWDCAGPSRGSCVSNNDPWSEASRPWEGDEISLSPLSRDPLLPWGSACGCSVAPKGPTLARDLAESAEAAAAADSADGGGASSETAGDAATAATLMESASTAESTGVNDTAVPVCMTVVACVSAMGSACCPAAAATGGTATVLMGALCSVVPCMHTSVDISRTCEHSRCTDERCVCLCAVLPHSQQCGAAAAAAHHQSAWRTSRMQQQKADDLWGGSNSGPSG